MPRTIRDPKARDRIVEAAASVVAARGVDGATMRAIATQGGVSTGFITHYFEDKQELMLEVLRQTNAAAARRVLKASSKGSALERLRAAVEAMLPFDSSRRREWQVWVAVWTQASPGDALGRGYRTGWIGLRGIFAELLERARLEGEIGTRVDVEYEADRLVAMLAGVGLLAGVETRARVRELATRMLTAQLESLDGARSRAAAA